MELLEDEFMSIHGVQEVTPIQIREVDGDALVFIDIGCPIQEWSIFIIRHNLDFKFAKLLKFLI